MKMRIQVTIENEDESALVEAFTGPEVFDQVFERYEREVIEARNGVVNVSWEIPKLWML